MSFIYKRYICTKNERGILKLVVNFNVVFFFAGQGLWHLKKAMWRCNGISNFNYLNVYFKKTESFSDTL